MNGIFRIFLLNMIKLVMKVEQGELVFTSGHKRALCCWVDTSSFPLG